MFQGSVSGTFLSRICITDSSVFCILSWSNAPLELYDQAPDQSRAKESASPSLQNMSDGAIDLPYVS